MIDLWAIPEAKLYISFLTICSTILMFIRFIEHHQIDATKFGMRVLSLRHVLRNAEIQIKMYIYIASSAIAHFFKKQIIYKYYYY